MVAACCRAIVKVKDGVQVLLCFLAQTKSTGSFSQNCLCTSLQKFIRVCQREANAVHDVREEQRCCSVGC